MSASGGNAPDEINSADNTKTTVSAKVVPGALTAGAAPLLFMRLHLNRPTSQTRSPTKIEGLHRVATWVAHFVASCDVYRRIGAGVVVELE